MDNSEYREGTPGGQARRSRNRKSEAKAGTGFIAAQIDPDAFYSTTGAAQVTGASEDSVGIWKRKGLTYIPKDAIGTRQDRIKGAWLIEFWNKLQVCEDPTMQQKR